MCNLIRTSYNFGFYLIDYLLEEIKLNQEMCFSWNYLLTETNLLYCLGCLTEKYINICMAFMSRKLS